MQVDGESLLNFISFFFAKGRLDFINDNVLNVWAKQLIFYWTYELYSSTYAKDVFSTLTLGSVMNHTKDKYVCLFTVQKIWSFIPLAFKMQKDRLYMPKRHTFLH